MTWCCVNQTGVVGGGGGGGGDRGGGGRNHGARCYTYFVKPVWRKVYKKASKSILSSKNEGTFNGFTRNTIIHL